MIQSLTTIDQADKVKRRVGSTMSPDKMTDQN